MEIIVSWVMKMICWAVIFFITSALCFFALLYSGLLFQMSAGLPTLLSCLVGFIVAQSFVKI